MDNVLTTVSEVKSFLGGIKRDQPIMMDTETTGLDPWKGHRVCGISMFQNKRGIYIPLRMQDGSKVYDMFRTVVNAEEGVLDILKVFGFNIAEFFHSKFDQKMFRADNIQLGKIGCTYVASSLVLAGKKQTGGKKQRLGLKAIARDILQLDVKESDMLDKWFEQNGMKNDSDKRYDLVPLDILAPYAIADVELLSHVHPWSQKELKKWGMEKVYELEMEVSNTLSNMEWDGAFVDVEHCERNRSELEKKIKDLKSELSFDPEKDQDIVKALQEAGVKLEATTEKGELSVDKEVLKKIDHPIAHKVLEFRGYKSPYNFFNGLLERCDSKGLVHPEFQQFSSGQTPGRTACRTPNMQNLPNNKKWGVRGAFIAPKGYKYILGDYSQLHLRIAANIADEKPMQEAFLNKSDIHAFTASLIYGVDIDKVDVMQRRRAKDVNFCMMYGGGVKKLALTAGINEIEAAKIFERFHKAYPKLRHSSEEMHKQAERYGYLQAPSGRLRFIDDFHKAFNTIILGIEADVTKSALVKLDKASRSIGGRVINFVHDEVQFYVPEETSDEKILEMMREIEDHSGKVPLTVDTSIANPSWADKKELKHTPKTIVYMGENKMPEEDLKVKVLDMSLTELEKSDLMLKVKLKDQSFIYIAPTDVEKAKLDNGKRKIYTVKDLREMIGAVQKGGQK